MNELDLLEQHAVDAAIKLRWEDALEINKKILSLDKKNLAGHLRIGYTYWQLGKLNEAIKYYNKVIRLQPANQLAKENLERIKVLQLRGNKKSNNYGNSVNLDPNLFIDSPARTKSVRLINLGQKNNLAQLMIGQEVALKQKKRRIEVRTKNEDYIGSLPDDLSKRLILFIKAGSQYSAFVKEVELNRIVVFIREEKKGKKVLHFPSFPKNTSENLMSMQNAEESGEADDEEPLENDLEKLAEALASEEKDYLPFASDNEGSDEEEE